MISLPVDSGEADLIEAERRMATAAWGEWGRLGEGLAVITNNWVWHTGLGDGIGGPEFKARLGYIAS